MRFDPPTLFAVLVVSTLTCTALLLWSWWQNRRETSLLWLGAGYALAGIGNLLLASRGIVPDVVSIVLANGLIIYGMGLGWVAARAFNGRPTRQFLPIGGTFAWLGLTLLTPVGDSFEWRVITVAIITAGFCILAGREFLVRDGLGNRIPVAIVLFFHAAAILVRIPLSIESLRSGGAAIPFEDSWFSPIAVESAIFIYALALLAVSLTKERIETRLRAAALTDPLTGLPNRRALFDRANSIIAHNARYRRPTAVIVFDLDRFKQINDTYGHPVGDTVLQAFASAAKATLRAGDCIGRIGGEEFAAILPDTDEGCARIAAERIMRAFTGNVADLRTGRSGCTASAGLSASLGSTMSIDLMLVAADKALYEAKRLGGNQLRTATAIAA